MLIVLYELADRRQIRIFVFESGKNVFRGFVAELSLLKKKITVHTY